MKRHLLAYIFTLLSICTIHVNAKDIDIARISDKNLRCVVENIRNSPDRLTIEGTEYRVSCPILTMYEDRLISHHILYGFSSVPYSCHWEVIDGKLYMTKVVANHRVKEFRYPQGENILYEQDEIDSRMERYTGVRFNHKGRMPAKFITGTVYITESEEYPEIRSHLFDTTVFVPENIYELTFNKGELISKEKIVVSDVVEGKLMADSVMEQGVDTKKIVVGMSYTSDKLFIDGKEYWGSDNLLGLYENALFMYQYLYGSSPTPIYAGIASPYGCSWVLDGKKLYMTSVNAQYYANEYTLDEIKMRMERFTESRFDKEGRMFARFITGDIYVCAKNSISPRSIYRLSFKKGKLVSKKIVAISTLNPTVFIEKREKENR